ncbi:hypothetical protein [Tomitella cavernea]|uniref:PE-PPE domain-containing protein n=1 Tax=Tomitella cavernea TaxID=1387982 RepID=A0ABP9CF71_9ACTN|nr:hypothetical protein [Tomitella cavernea]
MTIDVLTLRGIGEAIGQDAPLQTDHVITELDPTRFRHVPVRWDVTYGPIGVGADRAFDRSLALGVHQVLGAIDATENPAVLVAYSGGAALAGHAAAEIGRGLHPHLDVRAVVLIADPFQPAHVCGDVWGVAGSRDVHGIPATWVWDRRDPIPCTPKLSPLRTIADQSAAMSLADPAAWGRDLVDRVKAGRWQPSAFNPFDLFATFRRYQHAAALATNYLTGLHYRAYQNRGAEAAQFIRGVVG